MADKPPDGGKSVLFHVTLHPVNPFLLYEKIKPSHNRMVQIYTYFIHIQAGSKKNKARRLSNDGLSLRGLAYIFYGGMLYPPVGKTGVI